MVKGCNNGETKIWHLVCFSILNLNKYRFTVASTTPQFFIVSLPFLKVESPSPWEQLFSQNHCNWRAKPAIDPWSRILTFWVSSCKRICTFFPFILRWVPSPSEKGWAIRSTKFNRKPGTHFQYRKLNMLGFTDPKLPTPSRLWSSKERPPTWVARWIF